MTTSPLQEVKNWYDNPSRPRYDRLCEGYIALLIYLVEKAEDRKAFYLDQWEQSVNNIESMLEKITHDT